MSTLCVCTRTLCAHVVLYFRDIAVLYECKSIKHTSMHLFVSPGLLYFPLNSVNASEKMLLCTVSAYVTCLFSGLTKFIRKDNMEFLSETIRVFGNLTRDRISRQFMYKHKREFCCVVLFRRCDYM